MSLVRSVCALRALDENAIGTHVLWEEGVYGNSLGTHVSREIVCLVRPVCVPRAGIQ